MGRWSYVLGLAGLVAGCRDSQVLSEPDPPPPRAIDERPVVRSALPPPPIFGGTMLATASGEYVVVSEPDRDQLQIVGLEPREVVATMVLKPGDQPWRMTEADDGRIWVSLRGSGSLAAIDPATASVVLRTTVCANVRGIDFDPSTNAVIAACGGGDAVFVDAETGAETQRARYPADLRDVVVNGDSIFMSRFRSAEMLTIQGEAAPMPTGSVELGRRTYLREVAWRTLPRPGGGWVSLHQVASTQTLHEVDARVYYGNAAHNLVTAAVTWTDGDAIASTNVLQIPPLAVDLALSDDGSRYILAIAATAAHGEQTTLVSGELVSDEGDPVPPRMNFRLDGAATSVVFEPSGGIVAQLRNPAALVFVADETRDEERVMLPGPTTRDTGHDLFHEDPRTGITCASCHPEGGADGHTWQFDDGPRLTRSLNAGLAGTAPFHWSGEHKDFATLIFETHTLRMGADVLPPEREQAFQDWLFAIDTPRPVRDAADAAAKRGRTQFELAECDTCHDGAAPALNDNVEIGGISLQTPPLAGVSTRSAFMHNGRASTLPRALADMLRLAPSHFEPTPAKVDDLIAYLETL